MNYRHGMKPARGATKEYHAYYAMMRRCYQRRGKDYGNYGGRGIRVCPRWRRSFPAFLADMGLAPSRAHMLDRINNQGSYTPRNCRWTTRVEQNRNKRNVRGVTFRGRTQTIPAWAEEIGLDYRTLQQRLNKYRWPVVRALTESVRPWCPGHPRGNP